VLIGLPPWMGTNRYYSTYPPIRLGYASTYSIGARGILHQPQTDIAPACATHRVAGSSSSGSPRRGAGRRSVPGIAPKFSSQDNVTNPTALVRRGAHRIGAMAIAR
jgi:hypothetical protein